MKTAEKICFQGDVAFVRVERLPADARERTGANAKVVAHSETGHHHIVNGAVVFDPPDNPMVCYLRLETPGATIEHLRPHDTHETIALGGGPGTVWECRRQREHTPEGWRQVQD